MQIHKNALEIIKNYKGFIVDVWGVIHSGGVLYPNTDRTMREMFSLGKVVLLSNAPRRAKKVVDFLRGIGIKQGVHYHDILTSGEAFVSYAVKANYQKVFYVGPEKDLDVLHNTGIEITQNVNDNFDDAIVTGLTDDNNDLTTDIAILQTLRKNNITLSCINPDVIVKSGNGNILCAGAVAKEYEKIGGNVKYFGKPYGEVYNMVLSSLQGVARNQVIAIGDGMETDILGANNAGIDSLLCATGIHEREISYNGINAFLQEFTQKPKFVVNFI